MDERVRQFKLEVLDYEEPTTVICPFCKYQKAWNRSYLPESLAKKSWDRSLDDETVGELLDVIETHLREVHPNDR